MHSLGVRCLIVLVLSVDGEGGDYGVREAGRAMGHRMECAQC